MKRSVLLAALARFLDGCERGPGPPGAQSIRLGALDRLGQGFVTARWQQDEDQARAAAIPYLSRRAVEQYETPTG